MYRVVPDDLRDMLFGISVAEDREMGMVKSQ